MKATEVFEELVKDLDKKDRSYVFCKINEYNRICCELFYKKVTHLPKILELLHDDFYGRIEKKLNSEKQKSFLKNILTTTKKKYIRCYEITERNKRKQR